MNEIRFAAIYLFVSILFSWPVFAQGLTEIYRQEEATKRTVMVCATILVAAAAIAIGVYYGLRAKSQSQSSHASRSAKKD